jgi:hypothetical protein
MRPRVLLLPTLAVLAGGLSGCVASGEQAASTVEDPNGSVPSTVELPDLPTQGVPLVGGPGQPACSLAPASLVRATLGIELSEPTQYFVAQGIECGYEPVEADTSSIMLRFLTGQDHATFVAYRASDTSGDGDPADLAGLGDEAYYTSSDFSSPTTHTIVARKGSVIVVAAAGVELSRVQSLVQSILSTLA